MITVKAHFDGRVFVPESPVNLPVGFVLDIPIVGPPPLDVVKQGDKPLVRLLEVLGQFPPNPDWPADGASQHDHYLHGTPKRP